MDAKISSEKRLWTYDDLRLDRPETNLPTELWDGSLVMTPAPSFRHQQIVQRLQEVFVQWVRRHELGVVAHAPLDVILAQHRVVQPDLLFVSSSKREIIRDQIHGAPDLVIEVVSPGSWHRDCIDKKTLYEQFGVQEYWIVDPEAGVIEVYTLEPGGFELVGRFRSGQEANSKLLDGLRVDVARMLA